MVETSRCAIGPNGQSAVKWPKILFFIETFLAELQILFKLPLGQRIEKKFHRAIRLAQSSIFDQTALERPRFNFFWFFCFRPLYCNLEYRFCTKKAKKSQKKFAFWKKSQQGPIWEIQAKFGKVTLEALFQTGPQGPNNIFSCTHIDKTPWGLKWPSPKNCIANVLYWRAPVS